MPIKSSSGKWKWGNIVRSSKKELVQTVYGIWKKNGSKGSFSDFWHGRHKVNEDEPMEYDGSLVPKVGDRVRIRSNVKCIQNGNEGVIVPRDPSWPKYSSQKGPSLYYVKFDNPDYGIIGFNSGALEKINEDDASMYSSLTVKEKNTEFGKVWFISEINGLFSFSLYRYDDDLDDIYLSDVVVRKEDRGKGFGNKILELAEKAARKMNAKEIRLKVDDSNQFAHDWYKRHGFSDMKHDKDETSRMWMKKKLN